MNFQMVKEGMCLEEEIEETIKSGKEYEHWDTVPDETLIALCKYCNLRINFTSVDAYWENNRKCVLLSRDEKIEYIKEAIIITGRKIRSSKWLQEKMEVLSKKLYRSEIMGST